MRVFLNSPGVYLLLLIPGPERTQGFKAHLSRFDPGMRIKNFKTGFCSTSQD